MKSLINIPRIAVQTFLIVTIVLASSGFGNFQKAHSALIPINATESDLQFLIHVARFNMETVLLSQLAQQKSNVPDIQKLGKTLEETHSRSFIEIQVLAKKQNLIIPTIPNHKARWTYKKLNKKPVNDFNIAHCDLIVEEHQYATALFEKELKRSVDEEITKWVNSMLPILHAHLNYSLNCQKKCENVLTGN